MLLTYVDSCIYENIQKCVGKWVLHTMLFIIAFTEKCVYFSRAIIVLYEEKIAVVL